MKFFAFILFYLFFNLLNFFFLCKQCSRLTPFLETMHVPSNFVSHQAA